MVGVGVVGVYIGSLLHVVHKREGILIVDCLDYHLDFFVFIDEFNEFLDFSWSCRKFDYRINGRKIPVFPEVLLLFQQEAEVILVITCETQFNYIRGKLVDHQCGIFDFANHSWLHHVFRSIWPLYH